MALRFSISFLLALSGLTLINSVPIAVPMPILLGVPASAPAAISARDASPAPMVPIITNNVGNAQSGNAGIAAGGSATCSKSSLAGAGLLGLDNLHLLSVGSHNGADAGTADSGAAVPGSDAHVAVKHPTAITGKAKAVKKTLPLPNVSNAVNNANSGSGGNASGGSGCDDGSLIDLFSDNGGKGGSASSGASGAGLAGMSLVPTYGHAMVTSKRPRSIAFRKHAVSRKTRLSRMAYPYR